MRKIPKGFWACAKLEVLVCGGVAKWLNAADCKSAPSGFGGSNPSPSTILIHIKIGQATNVLFIFSLGYSQAVRQRTLTPSCVGSNPASPAIFEPLAQSVACFIDELQRQLARKTESLLSTGPKQNLFRVPYRFEPLAQSVEHLTFNQRVEGSSPSWLTHVKTPKNELNPLFLGVLSI